MKFHIQYLQLCLKEEERIITVDKHCNDKLILIDPMTWSQPSEHPKSSCMTSVMLIFLWSYNWL